jgi:hypothetical protein
MEHSTDGPDLREGRDKLGTLQGIIGLLTLKVIILVSTSRFSPNDASLSPHEE